MPEVASLRPGDPRRRGEYSIDGLLADDSVYLARSDTGERVTIKMFRARSAAVLAQVQEIQKVRLPDAYHTVQIIDSGVADGLPYIVMEFVDGDTLERTDSADLVPLPREGEARQSGICSRTRHQQVPATRRVPEHGPVTGWHHVRRRLRLSAVRGGGRQ
ncbi:hypothetical protein [Nonomuraea sp. NEAU-A123]|uniref:hypothetical protein n=1 Tax=Nonomuraea sp. NEAU-A123 TaxID=2839649 RepID=UPI001BE4CE49|nr:hypothetical protein [Nonomuraea sp. NEAU-A123]MBT2233778.1 hypothetical protein [Nonomuraea sp. NEAU-A123]